MLTLKKNRLFLLFTLMLIVVMGVLLGVYDKGELHLLLNSHHDALLDFVMRYYTLIAEYGVWVVAVCLLFYKSGAAVLVAASSLLSGAVTQIIKHQVGAERPLVWFAHHMPQEQLQLVDGVTMSMYNSFPSGHTTTFFALAMALSFIVTMSGATEKGRRISQVLFFFLAALGGYSRIYLSQHFASDVLAGCVIGTVVTALLCMLTEHLSLNERVWWNWHISIASVRRGR